MSWLIIAEKDKSARRIAQILFKDVCVLRRYNVNYYYSPSKDAFVLGLKGHIVEVDFPPEYNDWRNTPIKALLKAKLVWKVREKNIAKLLIELAKDVDRVTIATDYDREGELIGVEAIKIIKKVNPNVKVDRVRFSAITPSDIIQAFNNPVGIDYNLAKAAEVRQKIDLIWGAVLTRLLSLSSGKLGKDFLSAGRVQSPTLRLIVEREKQIMEFKSKKYWEVCIKVKGIEAKLKVEDKNKAQEILNGVKNYAKVIKFEKRRVEENKPIPFNTTEFLKEASRFMSPDKAMQIAEELYMSGYISYPRTDNTVYPKTLNLRSIIEMFLDSEFKNEAEFVLSNPIVPSKGKKETKDHPPIHPTAVASRSELSKDEWIIYELIVRRFFATLAPKAIWEVKRVEFLSGEVFKASGKNLIYDGWRRVYPYIKTEQNYIPYFEVGEIVRIEGKRIVEKKTKPPQRYTTGRLIKVMESLGLGTKSTRHEIIKKLYSRGYIYGNPIRPTNTAFAVIEALKKNAEIITLPNMTAELERDMDAIAEGKLSWKDVLKKSIQFLSKILDNVDVNELSECLRKGIEEDKKKELEKSLIGPCPNCRGSLVIKKAEKRFVGCTNYPNCKFSLPLPQRGRIYITSKVCEKHGLRKIKVKEKNKTWDLGCPYCNYLNLIKFRSSV
ncbi:MAG TPA: DNA topoisomerase I [Archaeoglobus profundus]|nr:DNA topoisomerase I [Archaeoglobus profundus]